MSARTTKAEQAAYRVDQVKMQAYTPKLSTARRKGYTFPAGATLYVNPKVKYEDVIMSHHYNRDIPFQNTGRKPGRRAA